MIRTYICKDGRVRAYDPETHKVRSYPRILMEEKLGRPLEPYEQVHHKDGNTLNNDLSNLEILPIGEHQALHSRKYCDKLVSCCWCGRTFLWTVKAQRNFYCNCRRPGGESHRGPFCSRECSGYYGRQEQLLRNQ